jgi:hypothetical protein
MINSLSDLIAYSETVSDPDPSLATPGLPDEELAELRERYPDLPGSYVDCLARVDVFGREIGPFRLSPPDDEGETFAEALAAWNDGHHIHDVLGRDDLLEVAAGDTDSLVIARGGDGAVLWVDERTGAEPVLRDLAPSFCDLLVMIGRADQITNRIDDGDLDDPGPEALADEIAAGIELTPERRDNWARFVA